MAAKIIGMLVFASLLAASLAGWKWNGPVAGVIWGN